jgi:hypothetical protein
LIFYPCYPCNPWLVHERQASREDAAIIRLAHFSDIHVTAPACSWRPRDWFNKRMSAWINLRVLGRSKQFHHTDRILLALREDLSQRNFHRVIFSGDATAMGF